MYFRKRICMAGALASAIALGCASQKSNTDSATNESFSQLQQQELASEREEFIKERREQLDGLDNEISRLEARLEHEAEFVDAEQKAVWSQELFELRQEHRQAKAELERAQDASPEEWAEMRGGFGHAVDTLQAAVDKAGMEVSQLFSSDEQATRANVDLCMIQVDGTSAAVLDEGDLFVVRLTTQDADELEELRERAEKMSRQVSEGSRAMAPGERPTGDTSGGSASGGSASDDWSEAERDRAMAPGERPTGDTSVARNDRDDTRAVAPGGRATGDTSDAERERSAMIEEVRVEHIDSGVRVIFQPTDGQRTALRQQLENDVEKIQSRNCG